MDRIATIDATGAREALYTDGVIGQQGAFSREWAEALSEDLGVLHGEALRQPSGALGRGPRRYYAAAGGPVSGTLCGSWRSAW